MKGILWRNAAKGLGAPLAAAVMAMIIGAIIVLAMGYNPLVVYGSLISGAFGNLSNIGNTLSVAIPLILAGLGIAIAFKSGLFNIGADGQYWLGAAAAVWTGLHFGTLPAWLHIIVCLLAAMIVGGLWGGIIPGLTKAYVGAHEVITTMMLSYIGILFVKYLIEGGPMQQPGANPESPMLPANLLFNQVWGSQFTWAGFLIAIAATIIVWFVLYKTTLGFQLRAVGLNQRASRYAGIRVKLYIVLALFLSGVLAGLSGGVQMLAVDNRLLDGFTSQYGYTAIVVSLLARNNPFGVILASLFFAGLSTGGQNMQAVSNVPQSLTDVLEGLIVFFVAAERLLPMTINWYRKRRPARTNVTA